MWPNWAISGRTQSPGQTAEALRSKWQSKIRTPSTRRLCPVCIYVTSERSWFMAPRLCTHTQKQQKCTHRCPSGCTHRCHGDPRGGVVVGGGGVFIDFAIAVLFGHKLLRRCHWGKCTCRCTVLDNSLALPPLVAPVPNFDKCSTFASNGMERWHRECKQRLGHQYS